MKFIICLILAAILSQGLTAPASKIWDLYNKNRAVWTRDYTVSYKNAFSSGEFGNSGEAGDINGDGVADFMLGDPTFDGNKGVIYVIYGKKGTLREPSSMIDFTPSDGFILKGTDDKQRLGFSMNNAGDVNGDGIEDIILGSYAWGGHGHGSEIGMTYVIFGRSDSNFPFIIDVNNMEPMQGFKIYGEAPYYHCGYQVAGAGDINGDGIADMIIGAYNAVNGAGRAYIVFGHQDHGLANIKLPAAPGQGFVVEGRRTDNLGNSVSKIGDFNGDGVDDIIIGAHSANYWTGEAYIVFGRRGGNFPSVMRTPIMGSDGITLKGQLGGNNFGCTVSEAGDFNGDGLKDVVVGAFAANGGRGSAYLLLGTRATPGEISVDIINGPRGFSVVAPQLQLLGVFVSGGRDLNGDGLSDIVVSGPEMSKNTGAVYVIYGQRQSSFDQVDFGKKLDESRAFYMFGLQEGDRFAQWARAVKDVNGDGIDDMIVGALGANNGKGAAYLFYLPWNCPANCASCSSASSCDACSQGFGKLGGNCVICPSSHQLQNGLCIEKKEGPIDTVVDWWKQMFNH